MVIMENNNIVPTTVPKEEFKVIPVREATRERLKNDMMKRDTYDSYINATLDKVEELRAEIEELRAKIAASSAPKVVTPKFG